MNKKHVKEKISYEFDIDSFERHQAYQIKLPTIGLERSTYIGILTYVDLSFLTFLVTDGILEDRVVRYGDDGYGLLNIDIDDYIKGDISIIKLGVVENENEQ
jgi:hypothetical protein